MHHRIRAIFGVLMAIIISNPLLAEENQHPNDTLRVQLSDSAIKPWLSFNDGEARKAFNTVIHHQALFFSSTLDISPGYIKSWKWDNKNSKFIFEIDTTLQYHNGAYVSAYDFEFVLLKPFLSSMDTSSDKVPLQFIRGSSAIKQGTKFKTGMASGIKVLSKNSIEVYLDSGHSRFLYALGSLLPPIAPINEFADDLYTFKGLPIGCGPYRVAYSDPKSSFVRAEKVHGPGPKNIEFFSEGLGWKNKVDLAFRSGITGMKEYMDAHPLEYQSVQGKLPFAIELLVFNYENPMMQNDTLREAISFAFEKTKELPGYPDQQAVDQIIPSLSYGYRSKASVYDQKKARHLFATLPKRLREQEYVISCHGTPDAKSIPLYYQWVKESLTGIGMRVKLVMSEETSPKKGDKNPTMFIYGRYIDPNPLTTFAYYIPGTSTETLKSIDGYLSSFEKAEASESIEDRAKYIQHLSALVESRHIVIPLHQLFPMYYYSTRLKSLGANINAWDINIQTLEIK